jgi:opacity protein-like surface antigen
LIHQSNTLGNNSEFNAFRTRTGITRIINENYGLGFALGTDNYKRSNGATYNTLPITVNAAYFFNPDLTGFKADIYGGYSIKIFNNLNRGLTAGAGLSYSVAVKDGLNLGLQTGYNYQEIDFPSGFFQQGFTMGSFRIGLGVTFK